MIRVGLIGYGLAGSVFHAPLVSATPGMTLTSVVTGDPRRQERVRQAHPGAVIFDRVDDLWAAAPGHDLVIVATPTGTHVGVGLQAVIAGLPAVIDKPLGSSAAEARQLVAEAARRRAWLSVFHNRRWDSETLTAKSLLTSGRLGRPLRFESRFERWRPESNPDAWREQTSADEGGGILLDLGSHLVDQALYLFGGPLSVYAEVETRRGGNASEDDVFLALEHPGGVRSHLWASALAADRGPSLRLLGSAGAYVKDGLDGQEDALRGGATPGGPGWGIEAPSAWGRLVAGDQSTPVETLAGAWPSYYLGVVESLTTGTPPPVTPEDAVAVLEVLDAARESARRRQVTPLPSSSSRNTPPA